MPEEVRRTPPGPTATHGLGPIIRTLTTLVRAGVVRPGRPDRTLRQLRALNRWGATIAGGYSAAAERSPHTVGAIDTAEAVTYAEIATNSNRLANGLASLGVGADSRVGVLCRNHTLMLQTLIACGKLGADTVLLNTGLATPQMRDTVEDTAVSVLVADAEFERACSAVPARVTRILAWEDESAAPLTVRGLVNGFPPTPLTPPVRPGRLVVLTSGTTGSPKGARRPTPKGPSDAAAVLSRIPLRSHDRILLAAPLFHTWGLAGLQLGMSLRATLVLPHTSDPEELLRMVEEHRCSVLFAVPVMLQRLLELPERTRRRYDTSTLRVMACSGSAMSARLTTELLDVFGDVLYNLYGSTEVSWATIATPSELRTAPTTAGRPPLGTRIAVVDEDGREVPAGTEGRVLVGNDMLFEGYTDGSGRHVERGLMETGDRGSVDAAGLLYVSGRDDDMIVSGGENVFPRPVEEAISTLPHVREVAVVDVADERFGQRFAAFVVEKGGTYDAEAIRAHVRESLGRFFVPRDVVFLDELPRNATGKVVKQRLRERTRG